MFKPQTLKHKLADVIDQSFDLIVEVQDQMR